jgi:RNA polymerase sigma-B factor
VSGTFPPGSEQSRERLIESHLPLVRSIARRYAGRGENLEDLVQVGSIGLIRASDRFDPDRGAAFATFAAPAIEGEIRRHLGDRASALRVPRELKRMTGEVQRCRTELSSSLGRTPTVAELAAALDLEPAEVGRALDAERALQPSAAQVEDVAEAAGHAESLASSDDRLLVAAGAHVLDERERRIVLLRFHADMTEQDIATELGISQAHVSRLLSAALSKLRTELTHDGPARPATASEAREPEPISPERSSTALGRNSERQEKESAQPDATTKIEQVGTRGKERPKKSGHSGRFLVRMPSALHEKLTAEAEREQVSLNRFVTDVLASEVSKKRGGSGPRNGIHLRSGSHSPPRESHSSPVEVAAPDHERPRRLRMLLAANIVVIVVAAVVATLLLVLALERGI